MMRARTTKTMKLVYFHEHSDLSAHYLDSLLLYPNTWVWLWRQMSKSGDDAVESAGAAPGRRRSDQSVSDHVMPREGEEVDAGAEDEHDGDDHLSKSHF